MKQLLKYAAFIGALTLTSAGFAQQFKGFANCDDGEIRIRFSHVNNAKRNPKALAANLLEQRVNTEMNGLACMEVFPNSSLYNDDEALEAMLAGDLELAAPSLSKFEKYTKQFRLFDLPFMFQDIQAVDTFQNSPEGMAMLDSMRGSGLQGLAYWHNGMKQLSANVPLIRPTDADGLKFGLQPSDVLAAQMMAIGGEPHKMAYSEVYGGLRRGIIDGQEDTWSNILGKKFFKAQEGTTQTDHGVLDYLLVTSVAWLDGLAPETREQFLQIVQEVTAMGNSEASALNEQAKEMIIAQGGVVRELSTSQRAAWIKEMRPVWSQFEEDVGADNINRVQQINCLQLYGGGVFCLSRQW